MKIAKGMKVKAAVKNYKRLYDVVGIVDELFLDGSYLNGNWYSLIVVDGNQDDSFVRFMINERFVVIVPEDKITEVISNETKES